MYMYIIDKADSYIHKYARVGFTVIFTSKYTLLISASWGMYTSNDLFKTACTIPW